MLEKIALKQAVRIFLSAHTCVAYDFVASNFSSVNEENNNQPLDYGTIECTYEDGEGCLVKVVHY